MEDCVVNNTMQKMASLFAIIASLPGTIQAKYAVCGTIRSAAAAAGNLARVWVDLVQKQESFVLIIDHMITTYHGSINHAIKLLLRYYEEAIIGLASTRQRTTYT